MPKDENHVRVIYDDADMTTIRVAAGLANKSIKQFVADAALHAARLAVAEFQARPRNRGADS